MPPPGSSLLGGLSKEFSPFLRLSPRELRANLSRTVGDSVTRRMAEEFPKPKSATEISGYLGRLCGFVLLSSYATLMFGVNTATKGTNWMTVVIPAGLAALCAKGPELFGKNGKKMTKNEAMILSKDGNPTGTLAQLQDKNSQKGLLAATKKLLSDKDLCKGAVGGTLNPQQLDTSLASLSLTERNQAKKILSDPETAEKLGTIVEEHNTPGTMAVLMAALESTTKISDLPREIGAMINA